MTANSEVDAATILLPVAKANRIQPLATPNLAGLVGRIVGKFARSIDWVTTAIAFRDLILLRTRVVITVPAFGVAFRRGFRRIADSLGIIHARYFTDMV